MGVLRHIIGLIIVWIVTALGAVAMPVAPSTTSQAEFFPHQPAAVAEHANVHFTARAPPLAAQNVAFTGASVAVHGSGIFMHGHETQVASLGFGIGFGAPNNGLRIPQGFTPSQFDGLSSTVRGRADQLGLGDDIFVQGSRAGGTASPTSDLDIAFVFSRSGHIRGQPTTISGNVGVFRWSHAQQGLGDGFVPQFAEKDRKIGRDLM